MRGIRSNWIALPVLLAGGALLVNCNLDSARQCEADADCVGQATCDLDVRRCVQRTEPGPITASMEVELSVPEAKRTLVEGTNWGAAEDGSSYLRSAKVPVSVKVKGAAPNADSAEFQLYGVPGGAPALRGKVNQLPCPPDEATTYCGSFEADLSVPALTALRGSFTVAVTVTNARGETAMGEAQIPVTRLKWARKLGDSIKATPAIGTGGVIFAPTADAEGRVWALKPDGSPLWQSPVSVGPVVASPAVGTFLYVGNAYSERESALHSFSLADGALNSRCAVRSTGPIPGSVEASIALMQTPSGTAQVETAVSTVNDTQNFGTLLALRPLGAVGDPCTDAEIGTRLTYQSSVVSDGKDVYFGDGRGFLSAYKFDQPREWMPKVSWPNSGSVRPGDAGQRVPGIAIRGAEIIGTSGKSGAFRVGAGTGELTAGFIEALPNEPFSPVVDSSGIAYFSDGSGVLYKAQPGATGWIEKVSTVAPVRAAPVLGDSGLLYTGNASGVLQVWDRELRSLWSAPITTSGFSASPTLDCARGPDGAPISRPGVLYLASEDGVLYAIEVDSKSLDTEAAWPKYQHDSRNTGNSTTPLVCP